MNALLTLVAITLVLFVALLVLGELREREVHAELEARWGSFDEVLERFPARREPNAAALELEELGGKMGISLAPSWRRERAGKVLADRGAASYVHDQFSRSPTEPPEPLPEELRAFIVQNEEHLRRILEIDTPEWERDLESREMNGIPNLLGLLHINRVLTAWALDELREGRPEEALAIADAAWRLSSGLRREPHLVTRLIGIAQERYLVSLVLRVEEAPAHWLKRVASTKHERALENSIQLEIWLLAREERRPGGVFGYPVISTLVKPYLKLCQLDAAWASARFFEEELARERTCSSIGPSGFEGFTYRLAWWNPHDDSFAMMFTPRDAFQRAKQLEIEAELMGHWLTRKDHALSARLPSTACESASWSFSHDEEGRRTLSLEGEVALEGLPGYPLLTRMTESPAH